MLSGSQSLSEESVRVSYVWRIIWIYLVFYGSVIYVSAGSQNGRLDTRDTRTKLPENCVTVDDRYQVSLAESAQHSPAADPSASAEAQDFWVGPPKKRSQAAMLPEGMGFDMETLKVLTLGNGEISFENLKAFCFKCYEVTYAVWDTDRSNPPEREELKQEFVDMMRDHVWVPTIACLIYVVFVFVGPSLVRSPWPVRPACPRPSLPPPAITHSGAR